MAPFYRRTKVEELGEKHPALREFVEERLARRVPNPQIAAAVLEQWGETLSEQVLSNHYQLRVWPRENLDQAAEREGIREAALIAELAAKDPRGDEAKINRVLLTSAIVRNKRKLDDADPLKMMGEQRRIAELEQRDKDLETQNGQLQVAKQTRRRRPRERKPNSSV